MTDAPAMRMFPATTSTSPPCNESARCPGAAGDSVTTAPASPRARFPDGVARPTPAFLTLHSVHAPDGHSVSAAEQPDPFDRDAETAPAPSFTAENAGNVLFAQLLDAAMPPPRTSRWPETDAPEAVTASGACEYELPGPMSTEFDGEARATRRSPGTAYKNASLLRAASATSASGSCVSAAIPVTVRPDVISAARDTRG